MKFWRKITIAFTDRTIRMRVLAVLGGLVIFRLLAAVTLPGVDTAQLQNVLNDSQFLGLLNIFSGGGLTSLSIIMLGVGPYITATIILQLLTIMVPRLKTLYHEEGEAGRKRFNQIGRLVTVPIAIVQGVAFLLFLVQQGLVGPLTLTQTITNLILIVTGSLIVMWLGELMTEYGVGSGVSILIFAGIVAVLPSQLQQLAFVFDPSQIPVYLGFVVAALAIIAGIVLISEAERPIPVVYAKQVRGGQTYGGSQTYIPLRINQAGVMPIIFGLSILLFPQFLAGLLAQSDSSFWQGVADFFVRFLNNGWLYSIVYFVLVFGFTFFYTAITFDAEAMAENLQKNGAFMPGIRPGQSTADYVSTVMGRITFVGALFLALIAVIPIAIQSATGISALAIGGTGLLIVVAVIIDIIKRLDAQVAMREY